ncbi:MAG TPA: thiamine pyrophosphate-binding protein [Gemmatimonadales bacterium]|jgi:acetolactate synthase-1/2/3 large subunit
MTAGTPRDGAAALAAALAELGVRVVFAVPGTQTLRPHDTLRSSGVRTVVPRHELAGSFMAGAYYRASGDPGTLITIGGPGFTYALTGLAQARFDSAALVAIVCRAPVLVGRRFQVQAMDELAVAAPIVKQTFHVTDPAAVAETLGQAYTAACGGEPGPVVVALEAAALSGALTAPPAPRHPSPPAEDPAAVRELASAVMGARRIVVIAGQGSHGAAADVRVLVERLGALVVTTTSGRGTVREDHALALGDVHGCDLAALNALLAEADLVLGLGAKFGDSGTAGFRLRVPPDRFAHVDTSAEVLGANYPAAVAVRGDVGTVVRGLLAALHDEPGGRWGWPAEDLATRRSRIARRWDDAATEPVLAADPARRAEAFFGELRSRLPDDAIITTDSGLHQELARRYLPILAPRGLMVPTGFQSMGCGIPAAIGARLAAPDRPVLAIVGDGGFQMAGMETLTAVAERVPLTVCILTDGYLGLIRMQQIEAFGRTADVAVPPCRLEEFAAAVGASYVRVGGDVRGCLSAVSLESGVNLVDVPLRDSAATYRYRATRFAKRVLPGRILEMAKQLLGR